MSLAVPLVVAPGASADKAVHRDARHDVVAFNRSGEISPRPGARDPDIVRAVVRHREYGVTMRFRFREFRAPAQRGFLGRILTPTSRYRFAGLILSGDQDVALTRNDRYIDCPNLTFKFAFKRDFFRTRIPRHCLGSPRWIKVGIVMNRQNSITLLDDAFSRSFHNDFGALTRRLHRS